MEGIAGWRRRAAVLGLVVLSVVLLARVVALVVSLARPGSGPDGGAWSALVAAAGSQVPLLAVVLVVGSCFLAPAVPDRRALALWGAVLAGAGLLLGLGGLVAGLTTLRLPALVWSAVTPLSALVVPLLAGWGLLVAARDARSAGDVAVGPAPVPAALEEPGPEAAEPAPDPENEPTWAPDAAAGAVWTTAGEAARGAPASGWGSAEDGGWRRAAPGPEPAAVEPAPPGPRELGPGPTDPR